MSLNRVEGVAEDLITLPHRVLVICLNSRERYSGIKYNKLVPYQFVLFSVLFLVRHATSVLDI